jgi:hypothetical protein
MTTMLAAWALLTVSSPSSSSWYSSRWRSWQLPSRSSCTVQMIRFNQRQTEPTPQCSACASGGTAGTHPHPMYSNCLKSFVRAWLRHWPANHRVGAVDKERRPTECCLSCQHLFMTEAGNLKQAAASHANINTCLRDVRLSLCALLSQRWARLGLSWHAWSSSEHPLMLLWSPQVRSQGSSTRTPKGELLEDGRFAGL